ncbi:CACTA en-spm transposon protein [Cucumis melo var. makuwa]|uniref:CACTA en-spm transposon protein n=1 Tax=Cucumis melo var. makuwa TaxID=1194695 RepID=A0A5D3C249_CUCMM|nr:CACTA en-spm transposon protein [Cucumis melo var. makuwa]TYK05252.1 CACTA en-spm transposon protein [Cucumis melo var. makuwa]
MDKGIMLLSYPCNNFLKIYAMFLKFADDLDNLTGGSSSLGGQLSQWAHFDDDRPWHKEAYFPTHRSLRQAIGVFDRVELFQEIHVRVGTFVLQASKDAHNQMLELQSQSTQEGNQPLSRNEICDQVLSRQPGYSKGLGWGPKLKACKTMSASSSSMSCS